MTTRLMLHCIAVIATCCVASANPEAIQERLTSRPVYKKAQLKTDWLIDGSGYKADVYRSTKGELVIANGLVARTIKVAPNAATVGMDDLVNDQALIRGVKPEAIVSIDGKKYDVGGLSGQPNYAFLTPEWIDALAADPKAFQLTGLEIGEPKERFGWKRVRRHAPDVAWPPKGVYLRMDYSMPDPGHTAADAGMDSSLARTKLLGDDFSKLDPAWKIHVSKAHERSSFENEGKAGEIYTLANTAVYAERALPKGTRLVESKIDVGTDKSAVWGPGMALVFKNRVVKYHIQPVSGTDKKPALAFSDAGRENINLSGTTKLDMSKPWTLRMRMAESTIFFDAKMEGGQWANYGQTPAADLGDPLSIRLGKMDRSGGASDHSGAKGELVRLRIMDFHAYGNVDPKVLDNLAEKKPTPAIGVSVHYELYDGIPAFSKWITVKNGTEKPITIDSFTSEMLAVVEHSNHVETRENVPLPKPDVLHVETDMAFSSFNHESACRDSVHWRPDPQYSSIVNYLRLQPCLLVVEPRYGPAQDVKPGATFESFRAFELVYDSTDRSRRGLALRRMYRTLAPWVTENPLMHHMMVAKPDAVRSAIDQGAEVGIEMIILSFGSGFDMDNTNPDYLNTWKEVAAYAKSKNIELGSYSLLSSRPVPKGNAIVPPPGQRATHGTCPSLTSEWGQAYMKRLYDFFPKTGFALFEHDGSYPGDVDVTPRPPLQKGVLDSQWVNWRIMSDFYKWSRSQGIYLNIPDYYYMSGSNKCAMGYREVNWSLPREHQVIHTRQNIYDGTWEKTPSMGWMFVPLSEYQGGGAAATIEPLDQHRDHYERMLYSNLAMGVQACYRGPRMYDTDATKMLVRKWFDWFKKYRDILESDMIHGRRADGRNLDWMLHVNPKLKEKGMLVVFNPLKNEVEQTLKVNLYYTGLTNEARIREREGKSRDYAIGRDYSVEVPVKVNAEGMTWFVIE